MKLAKFLILIILPILSYSQKVSVSKGSYEVLIEKNWSEEYAIKFCRENAKLNAIENAFGTTMVESNTLYSRNSDSSGYIKSDVQFYSVSNALVNGEWIRTLVEKDPKFFEKNGTRWVKIEVEGEVRELKKIPFTPNAFCASCKIASCSTDVFNDGQRFFFHFAAPKNGYLSIFLDDGLNVQRLLPYSANSGDDYFFVKGDKEYVFFDRSPEEKVADEIELFTLFKLEHNRIFVLYSTKPFSKPILLEDKRTNTNGYLFPKKMESLKFQEWLQQLRVYNKNIELKIIDIIIRKSK